MRAEVLYQITEQDESTNEISRRWATLKFIKCSILPINESGGSSTSDNKSFSKEYIEELETKMYTKEQLSKRWRISNIKNQNNVDIYQEVDKVSSPNTVFEVHGSHPILDMFGNIQYYENHLRRVQVQPND
jgi:hypothetical protein